MMTMQPISAVLPASRHRTRRCAAARARAELHLEDQRPDAGVKLFSFECSFITYFAQRSSNLVHLN